MQTRRHSRRWILEAILVLLVLAGAIGYFSTRGGPAGVQTSPPVGASSTPSPTVAADPAPTGCLGGPARDAAMVLAAQKAAPHTTSGGVEVAAAMVRWTYRNPIPSAAEMTAVKEQIIAATAASTFRDLEASYAAHPNASAGTVADGVPYYLSTIPGVWYVESASADEVTASIGSAYVVDGALSPSLRSVSTLTLVWADGGWRIESGELKRTTQEVFAIGNAFVGGC